MAKINKVFGNNHKITITSGALMAAFVAGSAFGSTITYNGTESDLEDATTVLGNDLPDLLGIGALDKGLINQSPIDGDIVIDYNEGTAPKFVIGGYSKNGSEVSNNKVTIKQGDIDGPVYGGLSHYTEKKGDEMGKENGSDTSVETSIKLQNQTVSANQNTIDLDASKTKIGDLTGGLANINLITGNAVAGEIAIKKAQASNSISSKSNM